FAHTSTGGTYAGTNRIDIFVVAPDGNLGTTTWFTCNRFDLDDTLFNFRNFQTEQCFDKSGMCSRQNNLWTLLRVAHFHDVRLKTFRMLVTFHRSLFALRKKSFHATKVEQRVTVIGLGNNSRDDVTFVSRIFSELNVTFYFADALGDHLLCSLC